MGKMKKMAENAAFNIKRTIEIETHELMFGDLLTFMTDENEELKAKVVYVKDDKVWLVLCVGQMPEKLPDELELLVVEKITTNPPIVVIYNPKV